MGYHLKEIQKGVYGEVSKIEEELRELEDALVQKNRVMALVELSDMVGAIKGFLSNHFPDFTILDLIRMADATGRAFKDGTRK